MLCFYWHSPILSCQLHVDQQSETTHSPLLAREHGTVYLLLSAPLPHTTSSKKTLNLTFLDCHSHCDNCILGLCSLFSALVVVYTTYCALQIVRLTLHYITPAMLLDAVTQEVEESVIDYTKLKEKTHDRETWRH